MLVAYINGQIKGFLADDIFVAATLQSNQLTPPLQKVKTLQKKTLYHYLGEEFAPFMSKFDEKIKGNPFKKYSQ